MTVYIGVDFHAQQQTISYLKTEDGEIQRLQLDHGQPEEVRRFYQQFAGGRRETKPGSGLRFAIMKQPASDGQDRLDLTRTRTLETLRAQHILLMFD